MPVLMLSYLTNYAFALIMNILTVMCFTGLHEVARELESPFQNAPNDVPLNYFQAQFNEALMTMFSGYHPDAYWEVCETVVESPPPKQETSVAPVLLDDDKKNASDDEANKVLVEKSGGNDNVEIVQSLASVSEDMPLEE